MEYPGTQAGPSYPSLTINDDFRIASIQPGTYNDPIICHLIQSRLQDQPIYEALSYTWGLQNNLQTITCQVPGQESFSLAVTTNCILALQRLRLPDQPRLVWIDSICINQSIISERNHQVSLMGKIYSQAAQVIIYLGEASEDSNNALDWIEQIHDPDYDYKPVYRNKYSRTQTIRPETQMLEDLFSRSWFNRVWVLQEVFLSKSAIMYCGTKAVPWAAMQTFKEFNNSARWISELPHVVSHSDQKTSKDWSVEIHLLRKLLAARKCKASDPRDKVYAHLPLLSSPGFDVAIKADYNLSPAQVFTDVAIYLMANIGIEVLCAVQGVSQFPGLPSWVPSWSLPVGPRPALLGLPAYPWMSRFETGGKFGTPQGERHGPGKAYSIKPLGEKMLLCMKAVQIGTIVQIGEECGYQQDYPPLKQWKDMFETLQTTNTNVSSALAFLQTITMDRIVYDRPLKEAARHFMTYDHTEENRISIQKWIKALPPSYQKQVTFILEACRGRRFFATDTGYIGLAPLSAEENDVIFLVPGVSVPFVFSRKGSTFALVGECYVQGIMKGEIMSELDESRIVDIVVD